MADNGDNHVDDADHGLVEDDGAADDGVADPERNLLRCKDLAALLGVSERHVKKLDSQGRLPDPVNLGRLKRFSRPVVLEWLKANCPTRDRWNAMAKTR